MQGSKCFTTTTKIFHKSFHIYIVGDDRLFVGNFALNFLDCKSSFLSNSISFSKALFSRSILAEFVFCCNSTWGGNTW